MAKKIYPSFWFDSQAKATAEFYCSLFEDSRIVSENPTVVNWELCGKGFMGINGGQMFQMNPSISMFVTCETDSEIDALWEKLSAEGKVYIPLGKYDWSEYYGWCGDKFGLTWQLYKGKMSEVNQKLVPLLLFANNQYGNAEKAIHFYTQLFPETKLEGILHYGKDAVQAEGMVMHAQFRLTDEVFMAMDGAGEHDFNFNEAISFVIPCENQAEIDYYWDNLTADGGEEGVCGWCKDKFGVSWQVIPSILGELMADPEKAPKVSAAFLKMKKFDIETLMNV